MRFRQLRQPESDASLMRMGSRDFAMRWLPALVLALSMSGLFSRPALAEKRVALVIGISNYQHVNRLTNPDNDAAMLAAMFR
ncbi:MAG TPA: caspase family protein, partial [Pseudolabrys sp.]|nr:caspase family protein [Pseudolabrys sp.]